MHFPAAIDSWKRTFTALWRQFPAAVVVVDLGSGGSEKRVSARVASREVARRNADFLTRGTNYLPASAIRSEFAKSFSKVAFVENAFLPYSGRPRVLARVPFGAALYGLLFSRFLYGMSGEASRSQPADAGS